MFCDLANSTPLGARLGAGRDARDYSTASSTWRSPRCTATRARSTSSSATASWRCSARRSRTRTTRAARCSPRPRSAADGRGRRAAPLGECACAWALNTGMVVVGTIGDNLRMDYTAIGDTTNLAARLQGFAEPGAIRVSDATRRAAEAPLRRSSPSARIPSRASPSRSRSSSRSEPAVAGRVPRRAHGPSARLWSAASRACRPHALARRLGVAATAASSSCRASPAPANRACLPRPEIDRPHKARPVARRALASRLAGLLSYRPFIEIMKGAFGITKTTASSGARASSRPASAASSTARAAEFVPYLAT